MPDSQRLALALAHAAQGREVFPFSLMPPDQGGRRAKIPKVKWTQVATTDEETIREWWRRWPLAMPGWKLPPGVVVVDVDDPSAFEAAGLEIDLTTSTQLTPRGGYHLAFEHDQSRPVRQTVKEIEGADTRVGGKGWVGLYDDDSFAQPLRPAPEWLYDLERPGLGSDEELEELGTRDDILRWVGGLRRARMSPEEILSALFAAREEGRIVDLDESRPWTDADLRAIAKETAKWEPGPSVDTDRILAGIEAWKARRDTKVRGAKAAKTEASVGLIVSIDEYRRSVPKTVPWVAEPFLYHGGVTLVAGPPKGGKSTLMANLQAALEDGGEFLGKDVEATPALLITEEGGIAVVHKTGGMSRLAVLDRRAAQVAELDFEQVLALAEKWCEQWVEPAVVFIDTLAVWAQIEDENSATAVTAALDVINGFAARTGAAIVLVHHTRKGGGEDGEGIRGSSAIFATVDIAVEMTKVKGTSDRTLDIQGRVVLPVKLTVEFDPTTLAYKLRPVAEAGNDKDPVENLSPKERAIAECLREAYPEFLTEEAVCERTGINPNTARAYLKKLSGSTPGAWSPMGGMREYRGKTPWYRMRPYTHMEGDPGDA